MVGKNGDYHWQVTISAENSTVLVRVVDPDPDADSVDFWTRIRMQNPDPDLVARNKGIKKKIYLEHFYTFFICDKDVLVVLAGLVLDNLLILKTIAIL
jgi:hypothetical protein